VNPNVQHFSQASSLYSVQLVSHYPAQVQTLAYLKVILVIIPQNTHKYTKRLKTLDIYRLIAFIFPVT